MEEKDSLALNFGNQHFVLEQLQTYLKNPGALSSDWIAFFQGMEFAGSCVATSSDSEEVYRRYGHLLATTNPLRVPPKEVPELDRLEGDVEHLKKIYSGNISYECSHVENKEFEKWFYESVKNQKDTISKEEFEIAIRELWKAQYLEEFLQKKFLGAKRFSLEGGESFMPMLFKIFELAATQGYKSGIIGMAHRGRLNVLCNLMGKPYYKLFQEFNTKLMPPTLIGLGDVKYHKGYTSLYKGMELILASNPSHLESVDPVIMGFVKAKGVNVLPLMIHGDASVAGQGVVYETLQFSKLKGYGSAGSIHIVINNQVGFTAVPEESRSTRYCTDIAKAFGIPVIHVNGDDVIACMKAAKLAFEIKHKFSMDVFIDLNCYRFYGHNEGDEPRFTNPLLYQTIESREDVYQKAKKICGLSSDWITSMENAFKETLETDFEKAELLVESKVPIIPEKLVPDVETAVPGVKRYLEKITSIPKEFHAHPKIEKLFEQRAKTSQVDWATGELLAYATLLDEKIPVRISGQDSKRGTFSHRHAVLFDQTNEQTYTPLAHVSKEQAEFQVYNSPLSEYAVLGFEFGYTLGDPKALVIWEAQFGDFANGAQIIIDQYIAGADTKWGIHSGLTLFLPHGHEGMGSEHTSCRIERFLELSGLGNWQVVYPSTPAQFFHILRKQALLLEKRPLIIPTPKSMLRLTDSFSLWSELETGSFQSVMDDPNPPKEVKKVILCTGKFYYELLKARKDKKIAIIRVEELYPFPLQKVLEVLSRYPHAEKIIWAQEEPINQGAWSYVKEVISEKIQIEYVGRKRIPIPDTGSVALFHLQQEQVIKEALE